MIEDHLMAQARTQLENGAAELHGSLLPEEIAATIRCKIIYEGLEIEELGIDLAEITDDILLFDEDGLNLDSIDALEILAGINREFGLPFPTEIDWPHADDEMAQKEGEEEDHTTRTDTGSRVTKKQMATVNALARMVTEMQAGNPDARPASRGTQTPRPST